MLGIYLFNQTCFHYYKLNRWFSISKTFFLRTFTFILAFKTPLILRFVLNFVVLSGNPIPFVPLLLTGNSARLKSSKGADVVTPDLRYKVSTTHIKIFYIKTRYMLILHWLRLFSTPGIFYVPNLFYKVFNYSRTNDLLILDKWFR